MQHPNYLEANTLAKEINSKTNIILLGIDIGSKKIGTAKAIVDLRMCLPLDVIQFSSKDDLGKKITKLTKEMSPFAIIFGCTDFSDENIEKTLNYIDSLNLNVKYTLEDENYTTKIANEILKETGLKRKKRNLIDDKFSAKLILDQFLNRI